MKTIQQSKYPSQARSEYDLSPKGTNYILKFICLIFLLIISNRVIGQQASCDNFINCGETLTFSTQSSGNNSGKTNCHATNFQGNDLAIQFYRSSQNVENWITLWNYGADVDLFLFANCPYGDAIYECLDASLNTPKGCSSGLLNYESLVVKDLPAGYYYILIDSYSQGNNSSEIKLSLSCEGLNCFDATPLACGVNSGDTRGKYNSTSNYYSCYDNTGCYNPGNTYAGLGFQGAFTGKEEIWSFTASEAGAYTFILDPVLNIDLELFVLNNCCEGEWDNEIYVITDVEACYSTGNCTKASTNGAGENEEVTYQLTAGQTIFLIVDGFLGAEGEYMLSVNCTTGDLNCDQAIPINCGESLAWNNYSGQNTTENYCDRYVNLTGNEVVYSITPYETRRYDILLGKLTDGSDLDLFLLLGCDVNNCVASSDGSANDIDLISVVLQASTTYYLVVDGDNNGGTTSHEGDYVLNINCPLDCSEKTTLYCDVPVDSHNFEFVFGNVVTQLQSTTSFYECGGGYPYVLSGPERIFSFTPTESGDHTFSLSNVGQDQDLDVFILEDCDYQACIGSSYLYSTNNADELTIYLEKGQEYCVVVDGYNGSESEFTIIVSGCRDCNELCCEESYQYFCEDFENYVDGAKVATYSGWTSDSESILVKSVSNNKFLAVSNENGSYSAQLDLNSNVNINGVTKLTFDVYLSDGDGLQATINYGQNFDEQIYIYIYIGIVDGDGNNESEIKIIAPNGFFQDYAPFNFDYIQSNAFELVYNAADEHLKININGVNVASIPNSGFKGFQDIYFDNQLTSEVVLVDNICLASCGKCPEYYLYDDDGFQNCDLISIQGITPLASGSSTIVCRYSGEMGIESIGGWEIYRSSNGSEFAIVSTATAGSVLDSGIPGDDYYSFLPGYEYLICYYYLGEGGCRVYCCIKIDFPSNCYLNVPFFTGDEDQLSFDYQYVLQPNEVVVGWFNEDGNLGSDATSAEVTYPSPGTYRVCCLIYNSLTNCYRVCCQEYCIENPLRDCDDVIIDYDPLGDHYLLQVENAQQVIQWDIDFPISVAGTIGSSNNLVFDPKDYGITNNTEIIISCKYIDAEGCVRVCCRRLCIQYFEETECNTWKYDVKEGSYTFSFVNPSAVDFTQGVEWFVGGVTASESSQESVVLDLDPDLGETTEVCCYYYDINNCLRRCCRLVPLPVPADAVIFDVGETCGSIGSTITIPVTVRNFKDVSIFGFELTVPANKGVKFKGIRNMSNLLQGLSNNSIGIFDDKIIISWFEANSNLVSIANGIRIFDVEVEILSNFVPDVNISGSEVSVYGTNVIPGSISAGKICESSLHTISGKVTREDNSPLSDIEVNMESSITTSELTDQNGSYLFNDVKNENVRIYPHKNDNLKDGVSIIDVAFINWHYTQKKMLNSDYKLIAADVFKDGVINALDVGFANQIYLEKRKVLSNNTSWRFMPKSTDISSNPLDQNLEEHIAFNPLSASIANADFIGVKVGDVNNSNQNSLSGHGVSSRMPVIIKVEDMAVTSGSTVEVPIYVEGFENVSAFGFQLSWDSTFMKLDEVKNLAIPGATDDNYNVKSNELIFGWLDGEAKGVTVGDGPLLTMTFIISEAAIDASMLRFSNMECLNGEFAIVEVSAVDAALSASTSSTSDKGAGHLSFFPNPFIDNLKVNFDRPLTSNVRASIYAVNGKLISTKTYEIQNDSSSIWIGGDQFPHEGLYYIKLETKEFQVTKKVVKARI